MSATAAFEELIGDLRRLKLVARPEVRHRIAHSRPIKG